MKLLIITQKVDKNDPVLGFFHQWLLEFAKYCEQLTIICLQKGEYNLPGNVKVLTLGKEYKRTRFQYIKNFYKYTWQERKNYDAVFVHMNPEYVVLGGLCWKWWHKKIVLWYTHKSVNLKLRLATKIVDEILTASQQSFRLPSKKLRVMGHGIDLEQFVPSSTPTALPIILQMGRISETKGQLKVVKIFREVLAKKPKAQLFLVGTVAREQDKQYEKDIYTYIKKYNLSDSVKMFGAVAHTQVPQLLQQCQILVNVSQTGSLDKDVLEAMACNIHPIVTNEAFKNLLPAENFITSFEQLTEKIIFFLNRPTDIKYRSIIANEHNLKVLIPNIIKICAA